MIPPPTAPNGYLYFLSEVQMVYKNLEACLADLEKAGELVRVAEEVDPELEMAAIHLRVHEAGGPALLFEKVKGSRFRAASNIFGTLKRSKFIFRHTLEDVQRTIDLKDDPFKALKNPVKNVGLLLNAWKALPLKVSNPLAGFQEIKIADLPLIKHWPMDGGAFVTLPQVYTEDIDRPGIMNANIGMYRIQLNGNDYTLNEEVGLHYQIHRGIGVHQEKANRKGQPLKVSIFVGGPPAHTVAAVMPLPEGLGEAAFAGLLAGRRFRYGYHNGYCISADADFVIIGEVAPGDNKPEGPFGDHLGYYSLQHPFPLMKVKAVYAKQKAVWPFTVVGRPPQEDTSFGALIHEITGNALQQEIPGLKEVNAVDAAGVHPLLLAIGSERYTPYATTTRPAELLTIANRILGTGQLSLAKFLFITAGTPKELSINNVEEFFHFVLERFQPERDVHFHTQTTIDTLDYSGEALNSGSKVVIAAYGEPVRKLAEVLPDCLEARGARMVFPGICSIPAKKFSNYASAESEMNLLNDALISFIEQLNGIALIVVADEPEFVSTSLKNFLWVSFTRCNPAYDIYGIGSFYSHKHWGCKGPVILDARSKPHHAPVLKADENVDKRIDKLFAKGGSLHGIG